MNVSYEDAKSKKDTLLKDINSMLRLLKNVDDKEVDEDYVSSFTTTLQTIQEKYKS